MNKKQELLAQLKTLEQEMDSLCNAIESLQSDIENINDEPLSASSLIFNTLQHGEWTIDFAHDKQFTWSEALKLVKAAEANNELRHKPKQSFDEWFELKCDGADCEYYCMNRLCDDCKKVMYRGWQACEKNRGYDE